MKKIYLSILMTLCPLLPGMAQQVSQTGREAVGQTGLRASAAQTSKPFLQEGKEWYTRCVHYFLGESFHTERIEGDTILDGVAYKKLYDGNVVEGFLREENGKVFGKVGSYYDAYDTSDWSSHLVYDFSLGKGDTTVSHDYFRLNVNTVDTILVDGESYRRLGIGCYSYYGGGTDYSNGDTQQYWVEGIGSDVGPDPGPGFDWVTSSYMTFDSCKVDGKLLFTSNDFLRIPHCDRQWICADYRKTNNIETHELYFLRHGRRSYACAGETTLNGKTYQKVYSNKYLFAMRREGGRVLADADSYRAAFAQASDVYPTNDEGEYILYDYDAHVGDAYLGTKYTVVQEGDTTLSDGQSRRMLVLSSGHRLIEGVGCVNVQGTPFDYLCHDNAPNTFFDFSLLENYYDAEGHRIYVNTREKAYEAIVAGVQTVATSDRLASDDRIYDLQGRRMDVRHLPKGIYIQHGKKFVVK